jgi:hypothetical protein
MEERYVCPFQCGLLTSVIAVRLDQVEKGVVEKVRDSHQVLLTVSLHTVVIAAARRSHYASMKRFTFNLVIRASRCDDSPPSCRQ